MKQGRRTGYLFLPVLLALLLGLFAASVYAEETPEDGYGLLAYEYVKYIDANFPYRVNNQEITSDTTNLRAMGQWIQDTVTSFGYQPTVYEQEIAGHDFVTYSFLKKGESEKRIVIGAHYDCVETNGCEDNGTGVALVMELAKRFYNKVTPLTLEFCFFDGEEFRGFAGSNIYMASCDQPENIALYINIDCVGAGDLMYAYGGVYREDGSLDQDWGLQMALAYSDELGIDLYTMPETVTRFRTPTRDDSSDHYYFMLNGIPYVYFEANAWTYEDGSVYDEEHPYLLNSRNEAFQDTHGQIIHTKYDNFQVLNDLLPGVMRHHLHDYSKLVSSMLERAGNMSPDFYAERLAPYDVIHQYSPLAEAEMTEEAPEEETDTEDTSIEETTEEASEETAIEEDVSGGTEETGAAETAAGPDGNAAGEGTVSDGVKAYLKKAETFLKSNFRAPEEPLDYGLYGLLALSVFMVPFSLIMAACRRKKKEEDSDEIDT